MFSLNWIVSKESISYCGYSWLQQPWNYPYQIIPGFSVSRKKTLFFQCLEAYIFTNRVDLKCCSEKRLHYSCELKLSRAETLTDVCHNGRGREITVVSPWATFVRRQQASTIRSCSDFTYMVSRDQMTNSDSVKWKSKLKVDKVLHLLQFRIKQLFLKSNAKTRMSWSNYQKWKFIRNKNSFITGQSRHEHIKLINKLKR